MSYIIVLEIESSREDGKLMETESGEEFSIEEAADVVIDVWEDVPGDYYTWHLRKAILTDDKL